MADEQIQEGVAPETVEEQPEATTGTEEAEARGEETGEQSEATEKDPYKPRGVQKRIDELTRHRYEAMAAAEQAKREREQMAVEIARLQQAQTPQETRPKPTREQFNYEEDAYLEALTDWKLEQRDAAAQRQASQRQQQAAQSQRREYIGTVNQRGEKEFPDYAEKVLNNPALVCTEDMALAMATAENGHKVAYFLGNNPGEAARIASLHPMQQAIEVGRLEARLTTATQKKTTSAPPPIKPVSARNSSTDSGLADDLPVEEWIRRRNAQVGKR